jgi:DNA-binding transcriptional regulator YdaS (Cro superfamily)
MTLDEYLQSPGAITVSELRVLIGARSDAQVRQWRHGYADRVPGPRYCVAIEKATGGVVRRQDLRAKDWREIWPELVPAVASIAGEGA